MLTETAPGDQALEDILASYGIAATLITVPLAAIDWDGTSRWQVRSGGVDAEVVDNYAAALERGERLPPGFAVDRRTAGGGIEIVGGAHRGHAYQQSGADRMLLYLIDSSAADELTIQLAAIEHNTRHGLPLTNEDRCRHGLTMVQRHGFTMAEAAAKVGVSQASISLACAIDEGTERAAGRVASQWGRINRSIQAKIATACRGKSDDVFAEAVFTANTCKLLVKDVNDFTAGIRAAATDPDALRFLETYEAEHHTASPVAKGSTASRVRRLAVEICGLDPQSVADATRSADADATVQLLKRTAHRIAEMALAIEEIDR